MLQHAIETPAKDAGNLKAELILGGKGQPGPSEPVDVIGLGWRSMVIKADAALGECRHAWIEIGLPGGDVIRPLVEVIDGKDGVFTAGVKHIFPNDRKTLETYHQMRSSAGRY